MAYPPSETHHNMLLGTLFCLISWAIARRGPTYPSMFNSLALIVTTVLDSVLLGTDVSVGR
jgi:hypothetical protein